MDKVTTGIEALDETLEGGLLPGTIMLVVGEPGTGKTTLLRSFLHEGVERGDFCVYLLTNRLLDRVLIDMSRKGWNVSDKPNMRFILCEGVANKRVPSYVGNFEDLLDLAYNSERMISKSDIESKRMIIDDLSYVFLMHGKDIVFKFLHRFTQLWRENNVTAFVEVQKGMFDEQIMTSLESMTNGTIETKREDGVQKFRVSRLDEEITDSSWKEMRLPEIEGIGAEAGKKLDEWQKELFEKDMESEERRVKNMLKDIRAEKKGKAKKGFLFNK
jgi:KaiC/GvpD/RAD55 family RecA-like ATPase